jgi:hypothetical protein
LCVVLLCCVLWFHRFGAAALRARPAVEPLARHYGETPAKKRQLQKTTRRAVPSVSWKQNDSPSRTPPRTAPRRRPLCPFLRTRKRTRTTRQVRSYCWSQAWPTQSATATRNQPLPRQVHDAPFRETPYTTTYPSRRVSSPPVTHHPAMRPRPSTARNDALCCTASVASPSTAPNVQPDVSLSRPAPAGRAVCLDKPPSSPKPARASARSM